MSSSARYAAILCDLKARGPSTSEQLARRLGWPRSTLQRYLRILVKGESVRCSTSWLGHHSYTRVYNAVKGGK